ncbi:hypothetical protein KBB96_08840 [Luteolibacter ambystomatis]|uniref:Histidine kinase/HSP90-like ATPase domain-containing protein n=2 Tax=Luteolibacter ambystomatis TaxID=2824561 RepID=A0A975J2U2_9BACT|nr:ATP-binding protein [Luteolibacter ambystomatis]QUE52983.1 hypothetical protein KBB96_08840 [Luteolibacter ambystomatis]
MVELLGSLDWADGSPGLSVAVFRSMDGGATAGQRRPPLSAIPQIRALEPDKLPNRVRIRGVVTCDQDAHSVTIQESGAGITCWLSSDQSPPLQMGDQIELTGRMIRGAFAPNVMEASVTWLGKGMMPEPARPARDLFLNGSLNARWVEVEGVVSQVRDGLVTVSMAGGPIHARVLHGDLSSLTAIRGAVVRVRGIVAPVFNDEHQILETYVRVSSPLYITVVTPAGADPFAVPVKRVPELREFDPAGASLFNRVRIAGQVIHASTAGYYLSDGGHGARFVPRGPVGIVAGMHVEVSGLPQLGGFSPVLEDAVVRSTGSAALPMPVSVENGGLFDGSHDATLVRLAATLVDVTNSQGDQLLELQRDHWKFVARLPADRLWKRPAAPGSELELTGVCVARDGGFGAPRMESFELLLNSPADIRILSQPPWWTTRRILGLAGVLSLVLSLALVWIVQLRRRVEERTAQLAVEIHQREVAEQRRAIEEERSRIARDLHDDLGAKVTKITMLAEQAAGGPDGTTPGVQMISDTSHELTRAMDEVVWTVNPRNDTLPRLAHYLLHYAENYFHGSGMRLRLKGPGELPEMPVHAGVRHHLLLAVKEALRNVMKHSAASECRMEVGIEDGVLRVTIGDNGRGIDAGIAESGRNGLANMKHRMEQLGGSCGWETGPGQGTTVTFGLALSRLAPLSS